MPALRHLDTLQLGREESESAVTFGGGLISSREDQALKYERMVSKGLENTLQSLGGVLEARVHVNFPRKELLSLSKNDAPTGSASVLLVVDSSYSTELASIRGLIAGASGVLEAGVTVVVDKRRSGPPVNVPITEQIPPSVTNSSIVPQAAVGAGILAALSLLLFFARRFGRNRTLDFPGLRNGEIS